MLGQVLHGQFRVDDLVADGKLSVLYRGVHLMLEVPIAIKCLKVPAGPAQQPFIRRFRHESRLQYTLSQASPHVVRVLAGGTAIDGARGEALVPFTILEWLEGQSLAQELAERRARGLAGRSLQEAVRLLDPAAEAFAVAHAHGIVHRAVTPENLFVARWEGSTRLKVLDFGVAQILEGSAFEPPSESQTLGAAHVAGSPYAAPEQLDGAIGAIGPWTDVYAFALIVMELLRDRPAMESGGAPLARRIIDPARRPTPAALGVRVSPRLDAVLSRAVALDPKARMQDAGEFWGVLKNAMLQDQDARQTAKTATRGAAPAARDDDPNAPDPPTLVRASPFAERVHDAQTKRSASASPLPSAPPTQRSVHLEEETTLMAVEELHELNVKMDESEPLSPHAELFVAARHGVAPPRNEPPSAPSTQPIELTVPARSARSPQGAVAGKPVLSIPARAMRDPFDSDPGDPSSVLTIPSREPLDSVPEGPPGMLTIPSRPPPRKMFDSDPVDSALWEPFLLRPEGAPGAGALVPAAGSPAAPSHAPPANTQPPPRLHTRKTPPRKKMPLGLLIAAAAIVLALAGLVLALVVVLTR